MSRNDVSNDAGPATIGTMQVHGLAAGTPRSAGSNAPLELHDHGGAWIVLSGGMNVFAVPLHDGHSHGAREFLFRADAGELLIGFDQGTNLSGGYRLAVIAVGDLDTVVAPVDRAQFERALGEESSPMPAMVAAYAGRIGDTLPKPAARYVNDLTQRAASPDAVWRALAGLHGAVLRQAAARVLAGEAAQRERMDARRRGDSAVEAQALGAMSSLLARGRVTRPSGSGTALRDALELIATAAGVQFRFPAREHASPDVAEHARHIALHSAVGCRQVRIESGWWQRGGAPLLAFTRRSANAADAARPSEQSGDQPVVLLPRERGGYEMVNTASGSRVVADAALAAGLATHALQFYRSLPAASVRPSDIWRYVAFGLRNDIRAMLAAATLVGLAGLVPPVLTRALVDHVVPAADMAGLTAVLLALLVASASGLLFEWVRAVAVLRLRTRLVHDLQLAVLDRMLRLPIGFFRRFASGDLGRRAMGVTTMNASLGEAALSTLLGAVAGLCAGALLFWYSVPLALVSCAMLLSGVVASVYAARRAIAPARARQQATGDLSALTLETLRGIAKLRVAAAESRIVARWSAPFQRQQQAAFDFGVMSLNLATFLSVLNVVARVAVLATYAYLSSEGRAPLSTGAFVAFAAAEGTFRAAVIAMSNTSMIVLEELPAWERAAPLLAAVPETRDDLPDPGVLQGGIEISGVHFAWEAGGPDQLHDVSLDMAPGTFVAIVGPSGSGKSTLLRLLLGFETPRSGTIRFDGQDLQRVDRVAVRRQMGVVLQNASLSLGDIYSNITGSTPRPQSTVWEATRLAGIEQEVRDMPMGLQTLIPDGGAALSGGQRQRLLIARALVNRPTILLMDEATSALDTRAQRLVSESIATLHATRVVIAHRLSTIRDADCIVVLDKGRIVERGTYAELVAQHGLFARMAEQQEA